MIVSNQTLKFQDKETFLKQTEGCFKTHLEANNAWNSYQKGESFTIHRKGGMELTVRPNQEHKIKIHGTPQVTGRYPNRDI